MTPPTNTEGAVTDVAAIAHPQRMKLDRRIHNQRVALRDNWMIVEQRLSWLRAYPRQHRYLPLIMRLHAENRALKEEVARLSHLTEQGVTAS